MILTVTLNPCVDHTVFVESLKLGDTNRVLRVESDAGGKGVNLSRVAVEMGAKSVAIGFLGGGPGHVVKKSLEQQGVDHDFVEIADETRTNFNVENAKGDPPTTFNAPGPEVSKQEWEALIKHLQSHVRDATWVALGGSLPLGVPKDAFRILGDVVKKGGKRLVLDADGEPFLEGLKANPDFVKPNSKEAERWLGRSIETEDQAVEAAKEIYARIGKGDRIAVLSRGKRGAILACAQGVYLGKSPDLHEKSTIGSGDSLIAGFLVHLEKDAPIEEAFAWGIAAGAATALTDGSEIGRNPIIQEMHARVQVTKL